LNQIKRRSLEIIIVWKHIISVRKEEPL
jgi:hypothetical protein